MKMIQISDFNIFNKILDIYEKKIHEDKFFALFLENHSKIDMIILFWVENLKKSQSSDQNCARLLKILQLIGLKSKINF